MTVSVEASGTQTAVISTEHTLATPTSAVVLQLFVDFTNSVLGDKTTLRIYDKVDGSNYVVVWSATFAHVQASVGKASPPLMNATQQKFTLQQTAGTGRNFPWSLRKV